MNLTENQLVYLSDLNYVKFKYENPIQNPKQAKKHSVKLFSIQ